MGSWDDPAYQGLARTTPGCGIEVGRSWGIARTQVPGLGGFLLGWFWGACLVSPMEKGGFGQLGGGKGQ